jgi:hypothetical protein
MHKDHPAPLTAQQIVASWKEGDAEMWLKCDMDPMYVARAYPEQNEFNFPPLEDPESVQLAGSMLFHVIAQGKIHPLRARILIKALQLVNSSMRNKPTPFEPSEVVRHVEQSATGVTIAVADSPAQPPTTRTE